jgi:hypothetical protein
LITSENQQAIQNSVNPSSQELENDLQSHQEEFIAGQQSESSTDIELLEQLTQPQCQISSADPSHNSSFQKLSFFNQTDMTADSQLKVGISSKSADVEEEIHDKEKQAEQIPPPSQLVTSCKFSFFLRFSFSFSAAIFHSKIMMICFSASSLRRCRVQHSRNPSDRSASVWHSRRAIAAF